MKLCIVTISKGNRPWFEPYAEPHIKAYAEACGADYIRGESFNIDLDSIEGFDEVKLGRPGTGKYQYEKFFIVDELLKEYDRCMWIDDTCMISKWCPNLFDVVPYGYMGVHNEGPIGWSDASWKTNEELAMPFASNLPIKEIPEYHYFNSGVAVYDRTHAHFFKKENLIKYGKLGWFSGLYVEQTYLNIMTTHERTPMFYLPHTFNYMLPINGKCLLDGETYFYGGNIFDKHRLENGMRHLYIDLEEATNPENLEPGGVNHAFIWHITSLFNTEIKTQVMKKLEVVGYNKGLR